MKLLIYLDVALFTFIAFFIGYDLFFTLTSFFTRKRRKPHNKRFLKFAIVFAAYKEDDVIVDSVEHILRQDYPKDKYRVIVVSDHMREETNQALAKLPIELLTPDFERSMKHKSITYALEYLKEGIDKVVILDADNLTDTDFLTRVNDITQDNVALQAHRTLKNDNTPIAVWDGISEEINNTIFRKGRVNAGLSSSLIGSGMVFDFGWLKSRMPRCGTFAEDKELEIYLATENIFVDYAEDILVYDEKTSRQEVMARQRSRWFHAQLLAFSLIIRHLDLRAVNWNYIDKAIQWFPFPRILKLIIPLILALTWSFTSLPIALKWYGLILAGTLTYTLAIPRKMRTRKFYMNLPRLPFLFLVLIKGYIASLRRVKEKDTSFQSTPHGITTKKEKHG